MTTQVQSPDKLLQFLHRGGTWAYLFKLPDKMSAWFQVGGAIPAPSSNGQNYYFGIHPANARKRADERATIPDITAINCLFAEFDPKDYGDKPTIQAHIKALALRPSAVIDSGGGYHCYWLLREPFIIATDDDRQRAIKAQAAWVGYVSGCNGSKDLARVLRLPGTQNLKYAPPRPVTIIVADYDVTYTLAELEAEARTAAKPTTSIPNGNGDKIPEHERNITLSSLAGSMRRRGMTAEAIEAGLLAENATGCAYPLPETEVRTIARSVAKYPPSLPLVVFNQTDMGNAQRFVSLHGDKVRYCTLWGKWLIWDGQRWRIDDTDEIVRLAKDTVRSIYGEAEATPDDDARKAIAKHAFRSESDARIRAMIHQAESEPGIPVTPGALDANPYLFNCANGTIYLRTGELRAHDPKDLITKMSPVVYNPTAQLDLWDSFIAWVTGDRQDFADYVQRAVGYSLTGDTAEEKLFMLLGPEATGKSTFAESIKNGVGDYGRTADFESFLQRSFTGGIRNDIADLAGARFVVSIEVDEGKRLAEGLVKTITGGDTVKARFLYHEGFEFAPQFKLWLAANHAPRVNADDGAMWRRIVRLPFERIVPKEKRDPEVKAMLRDPFVGGPAVLAWAVRGCLAWQRDRLYEPDVITQSTEAYRQEQDPLDEFFEECCAMKPEAWTASGDLRKAYEQWCVKGGLSPVSPNVMGRLLQARGLVKTRGHSIGRGWQGVGILALPAGGVTP